MFNLGALFSSFGFGMSGQRIRVRAGNKFPSVNNAPNKSFASDSRPQRRFQLRIQSMLELQRKFLTVTVHGRQWPDNMPRRNRRAITRDVAKRIYRQQRAVERAKLGVA